MESDKCCDHAYATVINAKTVENTREILKNKVDEVRLNDLNDAADHDPLCLNDMNENGRDVNSTETASDEMETKLEHKPSKEKEIVDERKDTNFDGKAGSESDSGTVLNIKSVFDEECADDNKLSSAEQVENNHCASNSSESSVKSIKEDNANSMATSEEDIKPSDSEKISDNDCEDSDNGEEVIEMESQIKSDAGNGIVMSLTRKRSAEAVKRKSDSSLKSPPSKYRKYLVVSTRRSPRISAVNGNSNKESEDTADEKISNKNVGTGIFKGDFEEDSEKGISNIFCCLSILRLLFYCLVIRHELRKVYFLGNNCLSVCMLNSFLIEDSTYLYIQGYFFRTSSLLMCYAVSCLIECVGTGSYG